MTEYMNTWKAVAVIYGHTCDGLSSPAIQIYWSQHITWCSQNWDIPDKTQQQGKDQDRVSIEENKNLVSRKYAYSPFISFQTACMLIFRFSCQLLARLRNHWTAYSMEWRPRWSCWRLQTVVRTVRVNVWCWQLTSRICRWHKHTKQQYSLCKPSLLSLAVENQGLIVANENWSSGLPSRGRWTSWKSRMSHRPSGVVGFYLLHIMLR